MCVVLMNLLGISSKNAITSQKNTPKSMAVEHAGNLDDHSCTGLLTTAKVMFRAAVFLALAASTVFANRSNLHAQNAHRQHHTLNLQNLNL